MELQTQRLVILDVSGTPVIRQWHVAHLAKKRLSPTAAAFKEFVLAHGRDLLRAQDAACKVALVRLRPFQEIRAVHRAHGEVQVGAAPDGGQRHADACGSQRP